MDDIVHVGMPFVVLVALAIKLAWYAGVLVLLVRIWQKVKHLPG